MHMASHVAIIKKCQNPFAIDIHINVSTSDSLAHCFLQLNSNRKLSVRKIINLRIFTLRASKKKYLKKRFSASAITLEQCFLRKSSKV
jgi:hypothetical protein